MSELKTKQTTASVSKFLDAIPDEPRRKDCVTITKIMKQATKADPKMWGPGIVGFGTYRYENRSGANDWFLAGFSPRKQALTLYLMGGFEGQPALMKKLGKYKTGRACLYIKSLADVDVKVLTEVIKSSVKHFRSLTA